MPPLGKGQATKSDEFSEKCQRGGRGSLSIHKLILLFRELKTGLFEHEIDTKE